MKIFAWCFLLCSLIVFLLKYSAYGATNFSVTTTTTLAANATSELSSTAIPGKIVSLGEVLMANYPQYIRPVYHTSTTTTVRHSLALIHIHDMDERNQILTLIGWVRQYWKDEFLVWNPQDFGGIEQIRLPFTLIWQPDIVLYNSGSAVFYMRFDTEAVVSWNGQIGAFKPFMMSSTCKIDATNFPFDLQACELKFGSWSYSKDLIDIVNVSESAADINNFNENGEWDLIDMQFQHNSVKYACCEQPYSDLTYTITLRRRWLFYMVSLILPCIMISILIILGYCLPPESGEKVTVSVTAILSLMVFLVLVSGQIPPTSDFVPFIQIYFVGTIAINTLSCVLTALVLNIHNHCPNQVPRCLRTFAFRFVAPLFRMKRSPEYNVNRKPDNPNNRKNDKARNLKLNKHRKEPLKDALGKDGVSEMISAEPMDVVGQLTRHREATAQHIELLNDFQAEVEQQQDYIREWKEVARIIDRLLFVFFAILVFAFTSSILIYDYIHSFQSEV